MRVRAIHLIDIAYGGETCGAHHKEVLGWYRYMGFPKVRGTFLGVPIIRTIMFWGLYWGPLIVGNYHIRIYKGVM